MQKPVLIFNFKYRASIKVHISFKFILWISQFIFSNKGCTFNAIYPFSPSVCKRRKIKKKTIWDLHLQDLIQKLSQDY